uniref:Uncharacterized protein n=1 Tax=Denticeps clupeoides TaxID=299321 RepID=A0AAY4EEA5_9TELE
MMESCNSTPPPSRANPRRPGSGGGTLPVLSHQRGVQDETTWDPGSFLRSIAGPVYQILDPPTPAPRVNNLNCSKNSAHLAWRGLSCLVVLIDIRF